VRSSPPPFVVAALPLGASSCSRGRHLLPAPNPFFCRSSRSSRERAEQRTHFFPRRAPPSRLYPAVVDPLTDRGAAAPVRHGSAAGLVLGPPVPDPAVPASSPPVAEPSVRTLPVAAGHVFRHAARRGWASPSPSASSSPFPPPVAASSPPPVAASSSPPVAAPRCRPRRVLGSSHASGPPLLHRQDLELRPCSARPSVRLSRLLLAPPAAAICGRPSARRLLPVAACPLQRPPIRPSPAALFCWCCICSVLQLDPGRPHMPLLMLLLSMLCWPIASTPSASLPLIVLRPIS